MNHCGYLLGEALLQWAQVSSGGLFFFYRSYFFFIKGCENLDVSCSIGIADVKPELIELVGRGVTAVEPNVARFGLAKLASVGFGNQRAGKGKCFATGFAAYKLGTGSDVTPLVRTSHLQTASLVLIEEQVVVALQQLIGELGERHTYARFRAEALLHGVFSHHIVDGNMLADVADKVQERIAFHPVVVVDQFGSIGSIRVEIKELRQLLFDTFLIVAKRFFI